MTGFMELNSSRNPVHDDINSHGMRCLVTAAGSVSAVDLRRFAAELMAAIASACVTAGAKDVSHVKAFIEYGAGFLHADIVGDQGDVKVEGRDGEPTERFSLVVNSVIYGLSANAVKDVTESTINTTVGKFGFVRTSAEK
ncbi:MAG: hypothetical protein HZB62_08690 [Nitrospirae bacterium]|nr:hypothetical protein [Nitrospirota bacterium]